MKKKQLKQVGIIAAIAAAFFALLVIISMFMPFAKMTGLGQSETASGFEFMSNKDNIADYADGLSAKIVMMLVFSIVIIAIAVLKVFEIPLIKGQIGSLALALISILLLVFTILTFSAIIPEVDEGLTSIAGAFGFTYTRGIGLILSLIFSIFAVLASAAAVFFSFKKK